MKYLRTRLRHEVKSVKKGCIIYNVKQMLKNLLSIMKHAMVIKNQVVLLLVLVVLSAIYGMKR